MLCLGVETSCDETSAAVVENGRIIRSNIIASQVAVHRKYGGVVPELASRHHVERICQVVDCALQEGDVTLEDLDLVGVTAGPGLVGALLVGLAYGKALAFGAGIPFVAVHHLEGHIHAVRLEKDVHFPFLCLVVSGGHTELIEVRRFGEYTILGKTRDDAAGEAFDKVAKMLGLGYPGGPILDQLARRGDSRFTNFPRSLLTEGSLEFSFSGVKTSVLNFLLKNGWGPEGEGSKELNEHLPHIAASFQAAVVDVLLAKSMAAMQRQRLTRLVVAGGVAANGYLRERFECRAREAGYELFIPSPVLCTDNAAMIAAVATYRFESGHRSRLDLNANAHLPLSPHARQG